MLPSPGLGLLQRQLFDFTEYLMIITFKRLIWPLVEVVYLVQSYCEVSPKIDRFVIWGKRKAINCISAKQTNELKILVPLSCLYDL